MSYTRELLTRAERMVNDEVSTYDLKIIKDLIAEVRHLQQKLLNQTNSNNNDKV